MRKIFIFHRFTFNEQLKFHYHIDKVLVFNSKNDWFNIFISHQFIQYNTIFNHTNIRIRTEARAYQVLLHYNILTKCRRQ